MFARSIKGLRIHAALLASTLILLSAIMLVGCGKDVTGTYVHEQKLPDGGTFTTWLELQSGGKAVASMKSGQSSAPSLTVEGTYTVNGDKVTVELQGDESVYTLNGGNLTLKSRMGDTTVLHKK